uniref:RBR-type E3 ubiquitin transferase n=2 Tax=Oryza TaxID=4527 RepID=A0A0E0IJZ7_ORYNI
MAPCRNMAAEAALEPNQEFLEACMPSAEASRHVPPLDQRRRHRVAPLREICDEPRLLYFCTTAAACPTGARTYASSASPASSSATSRARPRVAAEEERCPCAALPFPGLPLRLRRRRAPRRTARINLLYLYIGGFDVRVVASRSASSPSVSGSGAFAR